MFYTNLNESSVIDMPFNEAEVAESIYNDFEEGALNAMAENESNYNKLVESIGLMESAMFEQEGNVVYNEGMISSVWESLKKFVIKVWQKIVGLFKRFVAMFDQYFAKDKDFVKKYRARIMQSDAKDLEYDGYTFANLSSLPDWGKYGEGNLTSEATADKQGFSQDKEIQDQVDEKMDAFRAVMCGKPGGKVDASDFASELKEHWYGSDSAESLDKLDLGDQIKIIESSKESIRDINKHKSEIDKAFKKVIKELDDAKGTKAKAAANGDTKVEQKEAQSTSFATTILHQKSAAVTQTIGVILNAFKDRNRQARAICVKAMAKSGKFNNESADLGFQYPAYGDSFLSDIQFK